jgi:hypothetical protein
MLYFLTFIVAVSVIALFALGVGHHAAEIKKLGRALGIETVVVTDNR